MSPIFRFERYSPSRFLRSRWGAAGFALFLLVDAAWLYTALARKAHVDGPASAGTAKSRPSTSGGPARVIPALAQTPEAETEAPAPEADQPPSDRMRVLEENLKAMVEDAPARMAAVHVQDLTTGETASANADRTFLAASLIKVQVMAAAYARWEKRPELKTKRALQWVEQMITVSDNAATDRMIDLAGGPDQVNRFCAAHGCPKLHISHKILNWGGRRGLNTCTAREMVDLLAALDRRELVTPEADEEMWQVLLRQKKVLRIPAGVPKLAGVEVGNKTGTLGNALHDAGIVRTPRARYAICILLSGQRSEYLGNRFCKQVSRRVFEALHGPVDGSPEGGQSIAQRQ